MATSASSSTSRSRSILSGGCSAACCVQGRGHGGGHRRPVATSWPGRPTSLPASRWSAVGAEPQQAGAFVSVAYFGDPDEGYEAIQPLLEGAAPIFDGATADVLRRAAGDLRADAVRPAQLLVRPLPARAVRTRSIELTAAQFRIRRARQVLLEPHSWGGGRVSPDATAFAGREAGYNATFSQLLGRSERRRAPGRQCAQATPPSSRLGRRAAGI